MKQFAGKVIRTNNAKTAHVEVKSEWMHPKYLKKKTISHVFACHDLLGVHVGDSVEIVETRPMSATKFFRVEKITKTGTLVEEKPRTVRKSVKVKKK